MGHYNVEHVVVVDLENIFDVFVVDHEERTTTLDHF